MWYLYDNNSLNKVFKDELGTLSLKSLLQVSKNTIETILIGDPIVAGLSWYQNVWDKFLKSLKALNCGVRDDRIQHLLRCALNLPVFSNLKFFVVLCGTKNLLLDSPKDIADGILELARPFKLNYNCVNIVTCGIPPHDKIWSVNRASIKEVN